MWYPVGFCKVLSLGLQIGHRSFLRLPVGLNYPIAGSVRTFLAPPVSLQTMADSNGQGCATVFSKATTCFSAATALQCGVLALGDRASTPHLQAGDQWPADASSVVTKSVRFVSFDLAVIRNRLSAKIVE